MNTLSDGTTTLTLYHVLWPNRSADQVAGSERVTLGGRVVTQRQGFRAGREIVLEARLDGGLRGYFTGAQVEQLKIWRDAATTLTMTYDSQVVRGVIPLSGIAIEPVLQRSINVPTAVAAAQKCAGTLTILRV